MRRSIDAGQNWSADLRTIATATNPCLAVNVHGQVGFMYQQLGNPGTGNRWRTHLESFERRRSRTAPTDLMLADVPDANGSYGGLQPDRRLRQPDRGRQELLRHLLGQQHARQRQLPERRHLPAQRQFRHAHAARQRRRHRGGSLDRSVLLPLLRRSAAGDDFYVRDWTDSATSGDTGLEPSTHAVFYATSDVWNRRGTLPGSFPNDQPSNENAGNGAGNIGDNWAFARIRRNAAGSASTTVTAHFLVSKLGTGSNYVDAGTMDPDVTFADPDPTLVFSAADLGPLITPPYPWHLAAVSSTHLCLAVEISTPADPIVAPSLLGRAPGWPTTDLAVINDNNKAQRNMGLSTTPARGVGLVDVLRPGPQRRDLPP